MLYFFCNMKRTKKNNKRTKKKEKKEFRFQMFKNCSVKLFSSLFYQGPYSFPLLIIIRMCYSLVISKMQMLFYSQIMINSSFGLIEQISFILERELELTLK